MCDNLISKTHSKYYKQIIEIKVPVRFYWTEDGYDGFEFGSLEGCSKYQVKILDDVIKQLCTQQNNSAIIEYLKEHYKDKLRDIVNLIDSDKLKVPKEFLDAFGDSQIDKE